MNPAKLPLDLQQDVCLQCHLLADIIVPQPGYDRWSFRPGMRLRDVASAFINESSRDVFRAVGHGPQSMASACYTATNGRMTCLFCHDPHKPLSEFSADHYNQRCLECHSSKPCARPLAADESSGSGNCIACHMPKRDVADVPHASATEHRILREPAAARYASSDQSVTGSLQPFWPATSDGQRGSAIVEYSSLAGDLDQVGEGVTILEQALRKTPGIAEWERHLGTGYLLLDRAEAALAMFDQAIRHRPDLIDAWHERGEALLKLGKKREAIRCFEETLARWPWYDQADVTLARAYWEANNLERMLEMEEKYFQRHPDNAQRLELMAGALDRLSRPKEQSDAALERAIRADGSLASPHLVRGSLAIRRNDFAELEAALRTALRADPDSVQGQLMWARFLAAQGQRAEAISVLRRILARDTNNSDARNLLISLGTP